MKTEYQGLQQQFDLLIDKNNDPKAAKIRTRMNEIINDSLDVYSSFSGKTTSVQEVTKLLRGETPTAAATGGAPTGTMAARPQITSKETPTSTSTQTSGAGKTGTTTGSMPKPPTGGPTGTGVVGAGFDPARFRMGEEASMGATKPVIPTGVTATPFEKIMAEAVKLYGGIDEIFSSDEELKNLLIRAIGDVATAKDDMDEAQFINLLQNTKWFKSNAGPIRQRGFEKRQYDALVKQLKTDDPQYKAKIDELNRTSSYGRGLQNVIELLRENATALGRQISDDDLRVIAQGIYDYANEDDAVKIRNAILGVGTFGTGKGIVGGAAGQNLTTLRAVARANGLNFDTMFKDSVDTWLDKIAKGESIETFKSIIRNTAKAGLPERVASLLDQGVDLETI